MHLYSLKSVFSNLNADCGKMAVLIAIEALTTALSCKRSAERSPIITAIMSPALMVRLHFKLQARARSDIYMFYDIIVTFYEYIYMAHGPLKFVNNRSCS